MAAGSESQAVWPAYLSLSIRQLQERARRGLELLGPCRACPRRCGVDRLADQRGNCRVGRHAVVSSCCPHHGEEDPLRGSRGSGTIFLCGCNLHCAFCQNHDISQHVDGQEMDAGQLARAMLSLQEAGCHNINWVSPAHVVPQLLEAMPVAAEMALRLPIVYNTNGYDGPEALALLDGIVDIYMPDFKLWSPGLCGLLLGAEDYAQVARQSLLEMHRQVGDLRIDPRGLAVRGLLVRHLVMPGLFDETRQILQWIAEHLGPNTYLNVMGQYRPAHRADEFDRIDQPLSQEQYRQALEIAGQLGLHRLDRR